MVNNVFQSPFNITSAALVAALNGASLTGPLLFADGSAVLPSIAFATGGGDTGFFRGGSGIIETTVGGSWRARFRSTHLQLGSGVALAWSTGVTPVTTPDAGLSRISAGVVGVGTGAQGSVAGQLQVTTVRCIPTTVALLPAAATAGAGAIAFVTDAASTLGAGDGNVVVGGGANFSPVYSDATNWRQG